MNRLLILALLSMLTVTGCSRQVTIEDIDKAQAYSARQLKSDGLLMGTLPDGREVRGYCLDNPHDNRSYHWVYVVEDASSTTVNRQVASGKTIVNRVESIIIP